MGTSDFENRLRERRTAAGWTQAELARRSGLTRQSIIHLETGKFVPSTAVALRLARELACRVEDLFSLAESTGAQRADLAPGFAPEPARDPGRVVLGFVGGRWVAHRLRGEESASLVADGTIESAPASRRRTVAVAPLRTEAEARANLIVAGCDPALALLASWLGESSPGVRLRVLHAPSRQAIDALADGFTHVAGAHLLDEASGDYNVPFVQRRCARRGALVFNFARWEAGFVVKAGNPLEIRTGADLARREIRLVAREDGSGAKSLLERTLRNDGVPARETHPIDHVALGHGAVARSVAHGSADVGVATRSAAVAYGLGFVPLTEERSDLVIGAELADDPRVGRLVDALRGTALRRELASLGGYRTDDSGHVVAEVGRS